VLRVYFTRITQYSPKLTRKINTKHFFLHVFKTGETKELYIDDGSHGRFRKFTVIETTQRKNVNNECE